MNHSWFCFQCRKSCPVHTKLRCCSLFNKQGKNCLVVLAKMHEFFVVYCVESANYLTSCHAVFVQQLKELSSTKDHDHNNIFLRVIIGILIV